MSNHLQETFPWLQQTENLFQILVLRILIFIEDFG